MSGDLRKGWCPGALRPMAAKDGLLVRLRVTGGILPATMAHALADLATSHGNGLFDLSARANLQMRGVRETSLSALHDGLRALGLLDDSASGESVRNVIASPLAGLHAGLDVTPLTAALEQRLIEDHALHALPGKFGFLIDDGSSPSLADVAADVRFDWYAPERRFALSVGGTRHAAIPVAFCKQAELPEKAAQVARVFLGLVGEVPDARRMRHLVEAFGAEAVAEACGRESSTVYTRIGGGPAALAPSLSLAAPYGRLDAAMLAAAARLADASPHAELRLTPWRMILIPGMEHAAVPAGFVIDTADPRLAIAACPGAGGCARGTTDTHAAANILAGALPRRPGITLHLSGCEKGCAKPSRTPLTLVAHEGRYDLVRDGRAGDMPTHRNLDLIDVKRLLDMELA